MKRRELKAAREILIKYGFLLKFSDLEIYHGRVRKYGEGDWSVNPNFDNAGNTTGHRNVNKINALSAGDKHVAQEFADARRLEKVSGMRRSGFAVDSYSTELHQIVSSDEEAVIVNHNFRMENLSDYEQRQVTDALRIMKNYSMSVSEFIPEKFEDAMQLKYRRIIDAIKVFSAQKGYYLIEEQEIDEIVKIVNEPKRPITRDEVKKIVEAYNTRTLLTIPKAILPMLSSFVGTGGTPRTTVFGFPFSEEYLAAWLDNNHMVGLYRKVDSATLDKTIDTYSLFDLDKINTKKVVGQKYQQMMQQFADITDLVASFDLDKGMCEFLKDATPKEVTDKIKNGAGGKFRHLFDADAGIWERFTVGEHIETTLRVFEKAYEENIPKELIPFMKLALVSHDIGKGMKDEEPNLDQNERNLKYAKQLYDAIGLPIEIQQMLFFVIGDSQKYTTEYYVRKNEEAIDLLKVRAKRELTNILNREPTEQEVNGFVETCKMMQVCDSAAYTRFAVTRNSKTQSFHYNGNDGFTAGFKPQRGFRKKIIMKEPGDE